MQALKEDVSFYWTGKPAPVRGKQWFERDDDGAMHDSVKLVPRNEASFAWML